MTKITCFDSLKFFSFFWYRMEYTQSDKGKRYCNYLKQVPTFLLRRMFGFVKKAMILWKCFKDRVAWMSVIPKIKV